MAKDPRSVTSNREDGKWDHLRAETERGKRWRLIRAVMKYERRQSERDASKSAERYDREGDICNTTSPEMRRAGSASASDEIGEHVGAERKVLSNLKGWMVPWSKLRILASPLLHNGSHECARQTQHEAGNPNSNHEHGRSWRVEGIELAALRLYYPYIIDTSCFCRCVFVPMPSSAFRSSSCLTYAFTLPIVEQFTSSTH